MVLRYGAGQRGDPDADGSGVTNWTRSRFAAGSWKRRMSTRQRTGLPPTFPSTHRRLSVHPDRKTACTGKARAEDEESPIGEIVAKALAEGYTNKHDPYHGYYFRVLKGQGSNAAGGEMSYLDNGAMTKGFAIIAWPSNYGSTGIMTFVVDKSGIVYQKDLGKKTAELAPAYTAYDPDKTWTPVADRKTSLESRGLTVIPGRPRTQRVSGRRRRRLMPVSSVPGGGDPWACAHHA